MFWFPTSEDIATQTLLDLLSDEAKKRTSTSTIGKGSRRKKGLVGYDDDETTDEEERSVRRDVKGKGKVGESNGKGKGKEEGDGKVVGWFYCG